MIMEMARLRLLIKQRVRRQGSLAIRLMVILFKCLIRRASLLLPSKQMTKAMAK